MAIQNLGLLAGGSGGATASSILALSTVTAVTGDYVRIVDDTDGSFKKANVSDFLSGVADNSVTNAKLSDVGSQTIKGRISASTGNPEDLTATQVRTILNVEDGSTANPNALDNVSEDTTPSLGGDLDGGDNNIHSIADLKTDTITADSVSGGIQLRNNAGTAVVTVGAGGASATTISLNGATSHGGNNITGVGSITGNTTLTLGSTSNNNIVIDPDGTGNVLLGNFTFDADQTVGAGQDNYVLTYDNSTGLISLEEATGGGGSTTVINIGAATTTSASTLSGGSQLDLSTTHNHIITLDANSDTSHYDYTSLSDGDVVFITFTNASGSDKTVTFNTNDYAPPTDASGLITVEDGDRVVFALIKQSTLYYWNMYAPTVAQ